MIATWMLTAILAESAGRPIHHVERMLVPVPDAAMTCSKEGDHLVCVLPLNDDVAGRLEPAEESVSKARPRQHKAKAPTPPRPDPEALARLKVAAKNIELAKALVPKATTPEEVVLAEQLLYWAKEQYRAAEALLHTVEGDLQSAVDPFDPERESKSLALCQADVTDACDTAAGESR